MHQNGVVQDHLAQLYKGLVHACPITIGNCIDKKTITMSTNKLVHHLLDCALLLPLVIRTLIIFKVPI